MAISNLQNEILKIQNDINSLNKRSIAIINHTEFSRLPDEYVELQYIQSSGTQYFNTEYIHTSNTRIQCKINVTQDSVHNYQFIFGARKSSYNYNAIQFATRWNSSNTFCYARSGNEATGGTAYYSQDIIVDAYQKLCTWITTDNRSSSITTSGTANNGICPIGIFCCNQSSSSGGWSPENNTFAGKVKLYYFNILENNELVKELIPARRVIDNVLGLYDIINNKFIVNKGSGSFIAGPEV